MTTVAGQDGTALIGDNRHDKTKLPNTLGNLCDLLFRMGAGVAWIGRERLGRNMLGNHG
jgi:hypothetical protein